MDFFQSQETARRQSIGLLFFFVLAVLSLILVTNLLVMVVFGFLEPGPGGISLGSIAAQFDWQVFAAIGALVSLVIVAGSLYKTMAMSRGGAAVAESLGGQLIRHSTADLKERRTLNVVEEMAIAAGAPVPPVYLLHKENGINAFAAGYAPGDAVIGATRGAIDHLTRDELQGVVAHEFSHILNGDMRLNMRLICVLHGILLIGLIGYHLLRSMRGSSGRNKGPILGLGLGLITIGYSGTFFGSLIKASVNRQREFLADASAVQFTRNQHGIADALKKIGGHASGSALQSPAAPSMSHAYFSDGIKGFLQSIIATHPPLEERIRRIDPQWDGEFKTAPRQIREEDRIPSNAAGAADADRRNVATAGLVMAGHLLDRVGRPGREQLDYATALVKDIPEALRNLVHEPYGARAVLYSLVINDRPEIQKAQLEQLEAFGDTGIHGLVTRILSTVKSLPIRYRLPLIDMALPSLRQLSDVQYRVFKNNLQYLVQADHRIEMFEWSLQKILFHHLDPQFGQPPTKAPAAQTLKEVRGYISVLISALLHSSVKDAAQFKAALATAEEEFGMNGIELLAPHAIKLETLGTALDHLAIAQPRFKRRLLKACLAVVTLDGEYSANEMELMRAMAAVLDCPLPP
jgi:Zn-dependent protease with chaperone function